MHKPVYKISVKDKTLGQSDVGSTVRLINAVSLPVLRVCLIAREHRSLVCVDYAFSPGENLSPRVADASVSSGSRVMLVDEL